MKTPLTLAALAMCIALPTAASAQIPGGEVPPPPRAPQEARNAFFVNPILAPFGIYSVAYERVMNDRMAIDVDAGFADFRDRSVGTTITTGRVGVAPHFFLTKAAPRGLYIAPGIDVERVNVTGDYTGTGTAGIVSSIAGYAWAGRVLAFRLGIGGEYQIANVEATDESTGQHDQAVTSGFGLTGELKLGVRF